MALSYHWHLIDSSGSSGIICERDRGVLSPSRHKQITFKETRYSLSAAVALGPGELQPFGNFAIVILDDGPRFRDYIDLTNSGAFRALDRSGMVATAGLFTGIAVFQRLVYVMLDRWAEDWNDTLSTIDGILSLKVMIPNQV